MQTLRPLFLLCLVLGAPVWAQRRSAPPAAATGDRQIAPTPVRPPASRDAATAPAEAAGEDGERITPTCEQARRNARYGIYFDKVDIEKLVQTVSDATCKTFILPENVRGKISIIGPENGRVEVNADAFYSAFLASLDANGLAVYQHGRFMKIVDKRSAKQNPIPTITDPNAQYTTNEQMVTKLFKVRYVDIEPLRGVLQQLVSKDGDTIPFPPDTIIVNDLGSNIHRLEKIIAQLDARSTSDEVRIIEVKFASVADMSATIQKIFENKAGAGGAKSGRNTGAPPVSEGGGPTGGESGSGGPATLSQIIPDERTNRLIIVASPAAFQRIEELVRQIDVPMPGDGRINVYPLENANAEEMASTLQTLSQSGTGAGGNTGNRPGGRNRAAVPAVPGGAAGASSAELFAGEVKISADKSTNSLVVVASQNDYRSLVNVIKQLDIPRRQVFVEAVIMEVNLDRNSEFGLNLHSGYSLSTANGPALGVVGTKYSGSIPPSFSIANLAGFGGFLAGLQGPVVPALQNLGIPAFGVVLHALQQSSDVNVLSTPHILTSDNEEAEITVGQNVPFQSGFSPSSLGGAAGAAGAAGALGGAQSLLGGLGGLGSLFAPITRQNVELKLTVKPQINESDFIRMVITEQTEEIASNDPVLGPTTSKRSAKTTVVAKDQETVVIGGIIQDRTIESVSKVPVLGDIPLLGHLFRETSTRKTKTNLLLFLTPYIIRDTGDFRRIFERKMKERQQFVEQFYGQVAGYDVAVDFGRKSGPLGRMGQVMRKEQLKAENGGPGAPGERVYRPEGETPPAAPASSPAGAPVLVPPPSSEMPPPVANPGIETPVSPAGEPAGAEGGGDSPAPFEGSREPESAPTPEPSPAPAEVQ